MANLNVRDIKQQDKYEYISMVRELFSSKATLTRYSEEASLLNFGNAIGGSELVRCLFIEEGQTVVGYAFLVFSYSSSLGGRCLWLEELYIKPFSRKKGVGSYFLNWIINSYKSTVKAIKLEVTKENVNAINFYKNIGFSDIKYNHMCLTF